MKVLEIPNKSILRKKFTCSLCGLKFKLEKKDLLSERMTIDCSDQQYIFECPLCGSTEHVGEIRTIQDKDRERSLEIVNDILMKNAREISKLPKGELRKTTAETIDKIYNDLLDKFSSNNFYKK